MEQFIVVCNAGSSNIKIARYNAKTLKLKDRLKVSAPNEFLSWYNVQKNTIAVVHRIVHGGNQFTRPVIIDEQVIFQLKGLETLAPLHQPLALSIIDTIKKLNPTVTQIACFDTSFHNTISDLEKMVPLPYSFFEEGICRYGFHGLSYEYIASVLPNIAGLESKEKVLVAHLGNGSSICGMVNLKSQAISMGFSALDGLMMGSRSGAIDPGIIIHLLTQRGFTVKQLEELLYHKSGILGISGISSDVKILEEDGGKEAKRALKLYCYIAAKYIGAIAMAIGGLNCLVFTGGIGENSSFIRAEICSYLNWLGLKIDTTANNSNVEVINAIDSNISVYVIPANEEEVMMKSCVGLIKATSPTL